MLRNTTPVPKILKNDLIESALFLIEQLNLSGGRGDFAIYSVKKREVVIRNNTSCPNFCTKKENCDVKFCNQRRSELQRGVAFIDGNTSVAITKCANLGDSYCEVKLNASF